MSLVNLCLDYLLSITFSRINLSQNFQLDYLAEKNTKTKDVVLQNSVLIGSSTRRVSVSTNEKPRILARLLTT